MILKKCDCGGELKPKKDFHNQTDPKGYEKLQKLMLKECGFNYEIKGYNCIICGQCYDENFNRENIVLGWLK